MPTFITVNANNIRSGDIVPVCIQVEHIAAYQPEADGSRIHAMAWSWIVSEKPAMIAQLIATAQADATRSAYDTIRSQVKS